MSTETLWDVRQDASAPCWLGLVVDNRQLFEALQDDWLQPPPTEKGSLLGVRSYLRDYDIEAGNRIAVRIQVDIAKLPDLTVATFRDDRWQTMKLSRVAATDAAVFWPGALPLFSVRVLTVSSEEQRIRLTGIGKRVSNIELPEVRVDWDGAQTRLPAVLSPAVGDHGLVVPAAADSIRGAMSMALWALPRIDPWLCLFAATLASNPRALRRRAIAVDARWWRFPPWPRPPDAQPVDTQERLWLAAAKVFGSTDCAGPMRAAEKIAEAAIADGRGGCAKEVEPWYRATCEILRSDTQIRHDDWRERPVGLAIQLVLARPEPIAFKTWFDDHQANLPPAVAWSAAALCGLWQGYRRLDTRFRGNPVQREVVAAQALRMCSGGTSIDWPDLSIEPPTWAKEGENFVLVWGGREFARKCEQERGKWYNVDLLDAGVRQEAIKVAKTLGWRCVTRTLSLEPGIKHLTGAEMVEVDQQTMKVTGDVRIQLSGGDAIEEGIDEDAFRHSIAVEPGTLSAPPNGRGHIELQVQPRVPGLILVRDFLSESEERDVLAVIDRSEWSNVLQRRVQHYGWRYDYKARHIDQSMRLGPLPDWAAGIAKRLYDSGYVPKLPDQVIVNEYIEDQGIAPHVDNESSFADGVAMVSLGETWEMWFRKSGHGKETLMLDRRSAAVLTGEARYRWTHEIPKRKSEPGPDKPGNRKASRVKRGRRISLTFRKVIHSA